MATARQRAQRAKVKGGGGTRAIGRDFRRLAAGKRPIPTRTGRGGQ